MPSLTCSFVCLILRFLDRSSFWPSLQMPIWINDLLVLVSTSRIERAQHTFILGTSLRAASASKRSSIVSSESRNTSRCSSWFFSNNFWYSLTSTPPSCEIKYIYMHTISKTKDMHKESKHFSNSHWNGKNTPPKHQPVTAKQGLPPSMPPPLPPTHTVPKHYF